jgi:hypothetical protein
LVRSSQNLAAWSTDVGLVRWWEPGHKNARINERSVPRSSVTRDRVAIDHEIRSPN